ncbi:probable 28S ribosomal protein S6, mitochondrial [Contarinia nasturtii]|uniref:probable 28S ribosomal protein S6, mitochondrial n=1 Tax=Contarinia nasturtii TaxID=265458 RepID=UPI0012D414CB|nr:probable 28S ribosomal protein S6, mitochondrial [Contarinia nasturtii]
MPTYEMILLVRQMAKPQFKAAVKRSAEHIFDRGGFIRKIDYLGFNKLAYKISKSAMPYREAEQIIFNFDVSAQVKDDLMEEVDLDIDIIRCKIFPYEVPKPFECTLEQELQPVSYREDVKKLLELQEKSKKKRWLPNMGIEYYPFQR